MDAWATFWGVLFVIVLVIFAVLAVVVTIGGFYDVKAMFQAINEQHQGEESSAEEDH